jgi:hypothetical protein
MNWFRNQFGVSAVRRRHLGRPHTLDHRGKADDTEARALLQHPMNRLSSITRRFPAALAIGGSLVLVGSVRYVDSEAKATSSAGP